jgi:hypothetical protein
MLDYVFFFFLRCHLEQAFFLSFPFLFFFFFLVGSGLDTGIRSGSYSPQNDLYPRHLLDTILAPQRELVCRSNFVSFEEQRAVLARPSLPSDLLLQPLY